METIRQLAEGDTYRDHKGNTRVVQSQSGQAFPATYLALAVDGVDVAFMSYQDCGDRELFLVCAFTAPEARKRGHLKTLFGVMTDRHPNTVVHGIFLDEHLERFVSAYNNALNPEWAMVASF